MQQTSMDKRGKKGNEYEKLDRHRLYSRDDCTEPKASLQQAISSSN
jgi:hypothetical protein